MFTLPCSSFNISYWIRPQVRRERKRSKCLTRRICRRGRNDSSKLIFKVKPVTKQSQLRARRNLTIAAKQIQKFVAKVNEKDAIQTWILLGNRCLVSRKNLVFSFRNDRNCLKIIQNRIVVSRISRWINQTYHTAYLVIFIFSPGLFVRIFHLKIFKDFQLFVMQFILINCCKHFHLLIKSCIK